MKVILFGNIHQARKNLYVEAVVKKLRALGIDVWVESRFARFITEQMGKKPGEIIKSSVILEAKVMLVSNDLSVQQVSDKLHFPNASFFCKYFKSATGCSPRQYQMYGEKAVLQGDMIAEEED